MFRHVKRVGKYIKKILISLLQQQYHYFYTSQCMFGEEGYPTEKTEEHDSWRIKHTLNSGRGLTFIRYCGVY